MDIYKILPFQNKPRYKCTKFEVLVSTHIKLFSVCIPLLHCLALHIQEVDQYIHVHVNYHEECRLYIQLINWPRILCSHSYYQSNNIEPSERSKHFTIINAKLLSVSLRCQSCFVLVNFTLFI